MAYECLKVVQRSVLPTSQTNLSNGTHEKNLVLVVSNFCSQNIHLFYFHRFGAWEMQRYWLMFDVEKVHVFLFSSL